MVSMSDVDLDALVYEAEYQGTPVIGFQPSADSGVVVSFAPQLAGLEITVDVLRRLIDDAERRIAADRDQTSDHNK